MYLTLDIGNTRIKFAHWDAGGDLTDSGAVDEFWEIAPLLSGIEAVAYSNVRAPQIQPWDGYTGRLLKLEAGMTLPFALDYKTPQTLGPDRIAGVAGAVRLFPDKNCLVLDAGTCIKFDLISSNGVYHGGSISPGLAMRYKALNHYTGKLPEVVHREFEPLYGQSTDESILAGVQQGFAGEAIQRVAQFESQYDDLYVILTGGDAGFLADRLKNRIFAEPLLVHYGLLHCLLNQ